MATGEYIVGRKVYRRPQALCFSEEEPIETTYGGETVLIPQGDEFLNFIILSDHNRSPLNMGVSRIGKRERGINARMRAYWIADKLTISTSWKMLPSRGWPAAAQIDGTTGINLANYSDKFTADGGAGGNELLEWHKGHTGSFWVLLAYDRYPVAGDFTSLGRYNEVVEMFIDDFSYDVIHRGGTNLDFWDIDIKLEEA